MKASGLNRCDVRSGCVLADLPSGCTLEIFVSDYKSLCQMFTLDIGLKTRAKKKKIQTQHQFNRTTSKSEIYFLCFVFIITQSNYRTTQIKCKTNVLQFIRTLCLAVRGAIVRRKGVISAFLNLDFSLQAIRKAFSDLSRVRDQLFSTPAPCLVRVCVAYLLLVGFIS